jgi:hypothetical protein
MKPSSTRFRHRSKVLSCRGGDAIEYARVISFPSGFGSLIETNCPGTNSNRRSPGISISMCFVFSESSTERLIRAVRRSRSKEKFRFPPSISISWPNSHHHSSNRRSGYWMRWPARGLNFQFLHLWRYVDIARESASMGARNHLLVPQPAMPEGAPPGFSSHTLDHSSPEFPQRPRTFRRSSPPSRLRPSLLLLF